MRPESLNILFKECTTLSGVGDKTAAFIRRLCGPYLVDMLFHLPVAVNHRPLITDFHKVPLGGYATLCVTVTQHHKPARKKQPYRVLATCCDFPCQLDLIFFNYHADYLDKKLRVGNQCFVSGKVEREGGQLKMLHPDYITDTRAAIPEFEPIYPLTAGLTSKGLARSIETILSHTPLFPEWQDETVVKQYCWPSWKEALITAHHPQTTQACQPSAPARTRLAYDELLANQLALLLVRAKQKKKAGQVLPVSQKLQADLCAGLPFSLTNAQQRVIREIAQDLASKERMSRLLQGDVGSGKTVVALCALLQTAEAGAQGVLMAPTDILARQHFESIQKMLGDLPVRLGLLTGREKGKKREALLKDLADGTIDILIGTHAVFTPDVVYHRLGLAIIDEQHKFGVQQRLALMKKEKGVNLLVMTATPIPRTLALTSYGDMDISVLDEKPANRQPIETRVMPMTKAPEIAHKLKAAINASPTRLQVYWVCPLVEESEKSDLMAAEQRYEMLKQIFHDRVGLVHGKMKGAEKDAVMDQFAAGELDVLVATTVIEVGVDVKTASIMVIEQAERFGLAGLHQLRGRVGRGSDKSTCLLLYGRQLSETAKARLKIMRETDNGFLIAEEDLKLRGAGEILGVRQSGLMAFRFADLSVHGELLHRATQEAKSILKTDGTLSSKRGEALKTLLYMFRKDEQASTLNA